MPNSWVRLWHEMPTDPKWRVVARKSGQSIAIVIAVYNFLMVNASANGNERSPNGCERGNVCNWNSEDVAAALDVTDTEIDAVIEAMQGRVLDGWRLTGWDKRQPKQEDGSAERAKNWRERKRTEANGNERPDKRREDADKEKKEPPIVPQGGPVRVPDQPKTAKTKQRTAIQQEFAEEWPGYWLKRGKDGAERAYEKARKQATREEIHAGVERMGPVLLREAEERGHTPLHPATWLNRGGWKDEVEPALSVPGTYPVRDGPRYGDDRKARANAEFDARMLDEAKRMGMLNA